MTMQVAPIAGKVFGAVVTGVYLNQLTAPAIARIKTWFLDYGFLVFPDQHLTDAENIAFGQHFGELEFGALPIANQVKHADGSYGDIISLDSHRMRTNRGNEAWHTDSTYQPVSSKCGILSAVTVPETGGETELADMRAAYRALDETTLGEIENLSAFHSTQYSQARDIQDFRVTTPGTLYHGEAYLRPLVKTHPETGVKNLLIGRHAFGIPGLARQASRDLLARLLANAVADPARVYRHKWAVGDTLLWDNRALLHRACPYDYQQRRVMIATRIAGDVASELAYYPDDPRAAAGRDALATELQLLQQEAAGQTA